jgi:carboxymethylenebutenolidase
MGSGVPGGDAVDGVIRIRPVLSRLRHGGGRIPVGDIALGGIPRGAVLLLCEPGDLENSAADFANLFAMHGYDSTSADLGELAAAGASDDDITDAVGVLLDHLAARGWMREQIGAVGYGFGGRAALLAATAFTVGAAVSVAPRDGTGPSGTGRALRLPPAAVRAPWLGLFAADDPDTPAGWVREFGAALDRLSPVYTQVVAYPGVSSAFYRDSREPLEHAASFDSWQRTLEWLNLRVVPRPSPLALAWRVRQSAA